MKFIKMRHFQSRATNDMSFAGTLNSKQHWLCPLIGSGLSFLTVKCNCYTYIYSVGGRWPIIVRNSRFSGAVALRGSTIASENLQRWHCTEKTSLLGANLLADMPT